MKYIRDVVFSLLGVTLKHGEMIDCCSWNVWHCEEIELESLGSVLQCSVVCVFVWRQLCVMYTDC